MNMPKKTESVTMAFRYLALLVILSAVSLCFPDGSATPTAQDKTRIIFKNVNVFDGSDNLEIQHGINVEVVGRRIQTVSEKEILLLPNDKAEVIDCSGKPWVLMPGMIDAHVHATIGLTTNELLTANDSYVTLRGAAELGQMLDRGFTSVRDMGGNTFGIKQAIDEGRINGPRVFPSGAIISQTSGHGDYRLPADKPRRFGGPAGRAEQLGIALVADGKDEVLVAVREQLRRGATQIKLASGGGVVSPADPLDVNEYTDEEIEIAVKAATDWGTYVSVHVYTETGCQRAVKNGVRCLEHAHLLVENDKTSDAVMKAIAAQGIFISSQLLTFKLPFGDDERMNRKNELVARNAEKLFALAKKHKVKMCFGTDLLLDPRLLAAQSAELTARERWGSLTAAEILRQATGINGELLALSGKRNSYDEQPIRIGIIKEGAVADLLLVNGNPLEKLSILVDWDPGENPKLLGSWDPRKTPKPPIEFGKNLLVIMKDGAFHKQRIR